MLRHFLNYDEASGEILGLHNLEQGDNTVIIPVPNIELSYDEWQTAIHNKCKVVDGILTIVGHSNEEIMEGVRSTRNNLLKQSDWTQFPDSPLSSDKRTEWAAYRQALRDLPSLVDLDNVIFPTQPI